MQEFIIIAQSTHTLPEMQITPCSSRCSEQIFGLPKVKEYNVGECKRGNRCGNWGVKRSEK